MTPSRALFTFVVLSSTAYFYAACNGSTSNDSPATGGRGGSSAEGSSSSAGGSLSSGGTSSVGGNSGHLGSGGVADTGGSADAGGSSGAGGSLDTGGSLGRGGNQGTGGGSSGRGGSSTTGSGGAGSGGAGGIASGGASGGKSGTGAGTGGSGTGGTGGGSSSFWPDAYKATTGNNGMNTGQDCMSSCHNHGFAFGGTVYNSSGKAASAVEVGIKLSNGKFYSVFSGSDGNFYYSASGLNLAGADIRVRDANGESAMPNNPSSSGGCNSCHDSTMRISAL